MIYAAEGESLSKFYGPGSNLTDQITLSSFVAPIIYNVIVVVGVLAFITLILAGFRYVSSAGNEKEIKNATDTITYSLIGLGLAAVAFVFTRILFEVGGFGAIFGDK